MVLVNGSTRLGDGKAVLATNPRKNYQNPDIVVSNSSVKWSRIMTSARLNVIFKYVLEGSKSYSISSNDNA